MTDRESMDSDPVKVLFIAGQGRSGSTILHNILGQLDGFTAIGEVRDIWQRGVIKDWMCGCRQPFSECEVWRKVLDHGFGGVSRAQAQEWYDATETFRTRHLPLTTIGPIRRRQLARVDDLLRALSQLYRSVRDVTGSRVIVDSTKHPPFGYLVTHAPGVDVRFLHFIRDAPAVSFSWAQKKEFQPGEMMSRKGPFKSALQWSTRNWMTERFLFDDGRDLRMRYEDFLVDPRAAVGEIVDWIGETGTDLPFDGSHQAVLSHDNHSVFGNEVRFTKGPVTLRTDERWRSQMKAGDVRKVKALTWPLRRRYGYTNRGMDE